ncbi:hypothetical protein FSARC_11661 [Fusarium sarcochroum]|uniref:Heterokaryon incompatibility domain-containing protein n=1 Tax=Fusarium sarcochroum TaxID=1208366 RepID=A0A8H4X062_9HYPO|nr:hypothetical protein FSARC_11661 [Fusarium sarcochroum]
MPKLPHRPAPARCEPGSIANPPGVYEDTLKVDQFRLVCLADSDNSLPDDVVHVSLETYQDEKSPEYEAVSCSWGGEDGNDTLRHPIYVGDYWDILLQTQNCQAMISYLRPLTGIRMLWVDAICVNQQDLEERGNQVAKMGQIYSECFQVILWLGDDLVSKRPASHPPRHRFQQLQDPYLTLPSKNGRQVTIQEILKRRYFSRVWVIQELILPPRILIPFGDKTFWVGPSMNADLQHQTNGSWSWEQTNAPWFQLATKGMLSTKSLLDMLRLTWKSQSSDSRDKVYGILGPLALNPSVFILISSSTRSLFRYYSKLLALRLMPICYLGCLDGRNQMPGRLFFYNETVANPNWDTVKESLIDHIMHIGVGSRNRKASDRYRLFRFFPVHPSKTRGRRSVFDVRPWYKDATVDANSGSLSLYLTRLSSICRVPTKVGPTSTGWYCYAAQTLENSRQGFGYLMSKSPLGTIVEIGDIIFLLDTDVSEPIYLILRKTNDKDEFRLIAACSHLVLQTLRRDYDDPENVPVAYLQTSLAEDLTKLHDDLGRVVCWRDSSSSYSSLYKYCFPGIRENLLLRDALPLFLGLANDIYRKKLKTWKTFEHAHVALLDPRYQPRITGGICELLVESKEADELGFLVSDEPSSRRWQPWERQPSTEDKTKVILRRSVTAIKADVEQMRDTMEGRTITWFRVFLKMLENKDIEERIMEKPHAEDYFRGGTHFGYDTRHREIDDEMYEMFQLDGSTDQVRII